METHTLQDKPSSKPYRLGVALSGGGARGFAHAGALKAIEEAGLKPDIVAGVSAGAVIAVMYGAGVPTDRMVEIFSQATFKDFTELKFRGGGLFRINKFANFILKHIQPAKTLADLRLPVHIGVTNFDTGKPEVFTEGEIGPRMMASCSIPIIFQPVKINGTNYVDGGVVKNMPSWAIRDYCDVLIGVNVSPLDMSPSSNKIIDVALRTFSMIQKANMREDIAACDVAIELREISQYKTFNLKQIQKVYNAGYLNARHALKEAGLWRTDKSSNQNSNNI